MALSLTARACNDSELPDYDVDSRSWLPPGKAHLIPMEIFSEVFPYTTRKCPLSHINLMLVLLVFRR